MTVLVAVVGEERGTAQHVAKLAAEGQWEKVLLVANAATTLSYFPQACITLQCNESLPLPLLIASLREQLQNHISDFEVAVNLISGTGKQHMAVLAALLQLGVGIRLVAVTPDGIKEV